MKPYLLISVFGRGSVVSSYVAFVMMAIVATLSLALACATRRGLPFHKTFGVLAFALVGAMVGARLWYAALNPAQVRSNPVGLLSLEVTHFALYGAIAGAVCAARLSSRFLELDPWALADACVPALGVGIALARVGCFLHGCCFGTVTDSWLGVTFPPGSPAYFWQVQSHLIAPGDIPLPVHPTELYELLASLACLAVAVWLGSRGVHPAGYRFLVFVGLFSAYRWTASGLRAQALTASPPMATLQQIGYLCIAAACVWLLYSRRAVGLPRAELGEV